MSRLTLAVAVAVTTAAAAVALPAAQTPKIDIVIHAGRLIDGTSTAVRQNVSILVAGEKIAAVQDGLQTPAGARVIDLRTATVMPGFIDSHTHITRRGHR